MKIIPFEQNNWQGRIDSEDGKQGLRIHQIIQPYAAQENAKVLLGFCSEEGVKRNKGRLGAKFAPDVIRKCLANLPVHFSNKNLVDLGNILVDEDLEKARLVQAEKIKSVLTVNNFPIIIGGGHETALGSFLGFIAQYPQNSLVINLDAHFDLRLPSPVSSSGTPFYEMYEYCQSNDLSFNYLVLGIQELGNTHALFQRANELKVTYVLADEMHSNFTKVLADLEDKLKQYEHIYLSIDMDVFDVSFAPGVSAPSINGLFPNQVKQLIQLIKGTNQLKLVDLVEVNPNFDQDNQTSKLASNLIYELIRD